MAYSEAQKKAVKKYNEKNYEEIKVRVKKNQKKLIKDHASQNKESVNELINRLLAKEIVGFSMSGEENEQPAAEKTENLNRISCNTYS